VTLAMAIRSSHCVIGLPLVLLVCGHCALAQSSIEIEEPSDAGLEAGVRIREGSESQARNGDIFGYQLMTERERSEYRKRLRTATTDLDKERIRSEHHEQMQARARSRGVVLSGPRPGGERQSGRQ
jgi:hypothetical protein